MATLITLQNACSAEPALLLEQAQQQALLWDNWLQPVTADMPAGEDPGYDDNFQQMREEVNKLSGADTSLTCELAENLLVSHCKDVRVATYYIWARLHRDGETGLADGLSLLAGLITRFGETLHPLRSTSRKAALEWLAASRVLDSLSLFPEVDKNDFSRIVGALSLIEQGLNSWEPATRPQFGVLYGALENRLAQSGGFDAVIPQNSSATSTGHTSNTSAESPTLKPVTSGRDLLDQAKLLAKYLRDQPSGWLSGHHLIKSIRLDTLHELPPLAADGRTRLSPPKPEHRALLKRLYLQQSWLELLEQTDSLFALGVNHLWLDLQWYIHQALVKAGAPYETWADINKNDFSRIVGALSLIEQGLNSWEPATRPQFGVLYGALENRLAQSGGFDAVIPQNSSATSTGHTSNTSAESPTLKPVTSGRDLLDQAKLLAKYLRDQPSGWLSGHHLIKSIRLDTLHELPPLAADGRTRLSPPKPEHRALLKRLYLQQSWLELLEQTDSLFALGVNHLWLDLQWYIHQALVKAGAPYETWADIIKQDLNGLLTRLPGLEGLAFDDGTPFADEVTLNWINPQVMTSSGNWGNEPSASATTAGDDDILQLEPEALAQADSGGVEAALNWLQNRPGTRTPRHLWLLRLLMARVAEQYGKNDMALHLLGELDNNGSTLTLTQWEPELLFEVKARRLKLLRMKASRADTDKSRLHGDMEYLLAGLIALDPARAAVLCG